MSVFLKAQSLWPQFVKSSIYGLWVTGNEKLNAES
jgi:hypothetical protein